jgi:hypothetical protein
VQNSPCRNWNVAPGSGRYLIVASTPGIRGFLSWVMEGCGRRGLQACSCKFRVSVPINVTATSPQLTPDSLFRNAFQLALNDAQIWRSGTKLSKNEQNLDTDRRNT